MNADFPTYDEVCATWGPISIEAYEQAVFVHPVSLLMTPAVVANAAAVALETFDMGDFGPQLVVEQMQELAIDELKSVMERFIKTPSLLEQTERKFHPASKKKSERKGVLTEGIVLESAMVGYERVAERFLSRKAHTAAESIAKRTYRCFLENMAVTPLLKQQIQGEFGEFLQRTAELNFRGGTEGQWDVLLRPKFQELMKETIRRAFSKKSSVGRQVRDIEKKIHANQFDLQAKAQGSSRKPDSLDEAMLAQYYLKMSQEKWDENILEISRNVSILLKKSARIKNGQEPHRKSSI